MQLKSKFVAALAALFLCLFAADIYLEYLHLSEGVVAAAQPARGSTGAAPSSSLPHIPDLDLFSVATSNSQPEVELRLKMLVLIKERAVFYTLGFLLSFLLVSWLLNKMLLSPVSRLKQVTTELARGNYLAAENLPEHDELTHVSQAFKQMAGEIAKREQAVNQQKGLYAALSQTSKTILRNRSPQVLFERVCDIAVTFGGFNAAWIGEVNNMGDSVLPMACAGINLESLKACKFDLDLTDPQADSPLAISVYGKCPSVIDEIDVDPGRTAWHRLARLSGSRSAAVFPIVNRQQVVATLTVYAQDRNYFTLTVHDLLHEMVNDLAFAIENYERNQAHQAAHESLEKSSNQLEAV
ncbi:MAG: GAF domain-containing protein, partial [gamma proteobacterium symbiont of Ctena orbiculata]